MKTLFPFCFFLFFFSFANSQAYTPFPDSNAVWTDYLRSCTDPGSLFSLSRQDNYIYLNGDTTINGLTYHRLSARQENALGECYNDPLSPGQPDQLERTEFKPFLSLGYLRQDTALRRVYYLQSDTSAEIVLYDFNLSVGDTVTQFFHYTSNLYQYDTVVVLSIDTFFSDKAYRRYNFEIFAYEPDGGWYRDYTSWIEGIGSTWGLLYPSSLGWYQKHLTSFSRSDNSIYPRFSPTACAILTSTPEIKQQPTTLHLSPNPTTNTCTMQWNAPGTFSATLFDITGREIMPLFTQQNISSFNINTTPLPPGLYFIKLTDNNGQFAVSKLQKE